MSSHLIIHDSPNPYWWNSPDIWVVVGADPNGSAGQPVVGQASFVWARVTNGGPSSASETRVDFYWGNPAAQMVIGTVTAIGSAFVDLAPGNTQDVLCLVPWMPTFVNGGHECVIAVAHGSDDQNPLPDPLPVGFQLDPPSHEQVAQLNLSVVPASMQAPLAVMVHATARMDRRAVLSVEAGGEIEPETLERLGLGKLRPSAGHAIRGSLHREPVCGKLAEGDDRIEIDVPKGTSAPVFVSLDAPRLEHGHYQLVHVVERFQGAIVGGVTYVVVNPAKEASK